MKNNLFLLLFCCLVFSFNCSKLENRKEENSKQKYINVEEIIMNVKAVEHDLFNGIQNKDTFQLSKILTEKFTYYNPESGEISREEFLLNIHLLPVKIESVSSNNLSVKVLDENLAIVIGIQNSTMNINGELQMVSVAFTDIFIRRNGKWYLDYANGIDISE